MRLDKGLRGHNAQATRALPHAFKLHIIPQRCDCSAAACADNPPACSNRTAQNPLLREKWPSTLAHDLPPSMPLSHAQESRREALMAYPPQSDQSRCFLQNAGEL
jgi:hypothetical protein